MTEACIGLIVLVSFSALSNSGRITLFEMGRACILPVKEKISYTYLCVGCAMGWQLSKLYEADGTSCDACASGTCVVGIFVHVLPDGQ